MVTAQYYKPIKLPTVPLQEGDTYCSSCMCHSSQCICLQLETTKLTKEEYNKLMQTEG